MLLTFGEAKNSLELKAISGVCSSGEQFKSFLNQAVEALMTRGNFFGTIQKARFCVNDDCVVFPRWVGTVLATDICGRSLPQKSFWWEFLPVGTSDWGNLGVYPTQFGGWQGRCGGNAVFENAGTTSVVAQPPCGRDMYVRAYPSIKADAGKTITIFGIDQNGQVIRTLQGGVLQEGVVLTLAVPFSVTPFKIRKIDRVVKDKTQGVLRLYYYDSPSNSLLDCASYDPTETSPDYNFSRLRGVRTNRCNPVKSIQALIKLQFVPVENDNDLVQIGSLRAIKKFIQAIRCEEAGDIVKSRENEKDAFRELNYFLRDKFPIEQFVCSFNPQGTARLARVTGGFI